MIAADFNPKFESWRKHYDGIRMGDLVPSKKRDTLKKLRVDLAKDLNKNQVNAPAGRSFWTEALVAKLLEQTPETTTFVVAWARLYAHLNNL